MNLGGKSSSKYFRYLLVAFVPQANDDLSVYVELVKLFFSASFGHLYSLPYRLLLENLVKYLKFSFIVLFFYVNWVNTLYEIKYVSITEPTKLVSELKTTGV